MPTSRRSVPGQAVAYRPRCVPIELEAGPYRVCVVAFELDGGRTDRMTSLSSSRFIRNDLVASRSSLRGVRSGLLASRSGSMPSVRTLGRRVRA